MQKYKPKAPLAGLADKLLRALVTAGLGVAWFVYLWGLSLPAIAAGLSLGGLLWLCARMFGKKSVQKKEALMRRMIGGELALNRLLLLPARHAAFQAAIWILPKVPIEMQKAVDWGVVGTLEGESALVRVIAQHESQPVTVQQVISVVREAHEKQVKRCVLCLTAPLSKEGAAYAQDASPPLRIVERKELVRLAGLCSPATDEELSRLGRKKRTRRSAKEWAEIVLDASRSRRYFWYGMGLGALALTTGQWVYPLPAAVCMLLFAGCKVRALHISRAGG